VSKEGGGGGGNVETQVVTFPSIVTPHYYPSLYYYLSIVLSLLSLLFHSSLYFALLYYSFLYSNIPPSKIFASLLF
jgi:hypothetical protein